MHPRALIHWLTKVFHVERASWPIRERMQLLREFSRQHNREMVQRLREKAKAR